MPFAAGQLIRGLNQFLTASSIKYSHLKPQLITFKKPIVSIHLYSIRQPRHVRPRQLQQTPGRSPRGALPAPLVLLRPPRRSCFPHTWPADMSHSHSRALHSGGKTKLATHTKFTCCSTVRYLLVPRVFGQLIGWKPSSTGDLTKNSQDCGQFCQFPMAHTEGSASEAEYLELPLQTPLSLEVGGTGIIGRRVSVCHQSVSGAQIVAAEGIVGFNF